MPPLGPLLHSNFMPHPWQTSLHPRPSAVLTQALRRLNVSASDAAQIESAIVSLPRRVDSIARSVNSGRRTLEENVAAVGAAFGSVAECRVAARLGQPIGLQS